MSFRTTIKVAAAALLLAAPLAACGKLGGLERPGPLFGKTTPSSTQAPPSTDQEPVKTVDPRDDVSPR